MRRRFVIVLGGFIGLLAAGILSGLLLRAAVGRGPTTLDRKVLDWFVDRRSPGLTDAVKAIQFLGRTELIILLVAVAGVLIVWNQRRIGIFLAVACIGAETFVDVIKPIVDRARPPARYWLERTDAGAYPSGHAVISTVIVCSVVAAVAVGTHRSIRWWGWCLAAIVPVVVGLSRIYLGVHWLTDVIAGWVIGGLWVALTIRFLLRPDATRGAPARG